MDPQTALENIRKMCADALDTTSIPATIPTAEDVADALTDLAETVTALDEWLTRGGFSPSDWRNGQR